MYYPYLRGRQNELLAIRDLSQLSLISEKVVPIIEPVKLTSTLASTIKQLDNQNHAVAVIENPKVGSFKSDTRNTKNFKNLKTFQDILRGGESIIKGWIVDSKTEEVVNNWLSEGAFPEAIICICLNPDNIRYLSGIDNRGFMSVIPYAPAFLRIHGNRILIEDAFNKKVRNVDYRDNTDEFFSSTHLYYQEAGYSGFSDYSIIGEEYSESGFAPHAVVIHIVYFDHKKELRIHHFVSDDSDDIRDPAGKFYQALKKLIAWNKEMKLDTLGMKSFEQIYESQSYPGLGYIKKLSIMHHLELMSRYLDGAI